MSTTNTTTGCNSSGSPSDPLPSQPLQVTTASATSHATDGNSQSSSPTQLYTLCASHEAVATFIFYSSIQKRNKTKTGWVTRTIGVTTRGEIWQLADRAKQALRSAETAKPTSTPIVPGVLNVYDTAISGATRLTAARQTYIETTTSSDLSNDVPRLTGGNHLALLRIPKVDLYGSRLLLSLFSTTPRRRVCVKMIDTFMTPEFRILADHRMLKLRAETTESKAKWLEALQICMYIQNELRSRASRLAETPMIMAQQHSEASTSAAAAGYAFRDTETELKHYDIVDTNDCDETDAEDYHDDSDTPLDAQQLHERELRRQTSLELTYSTGYIRPTPKSRSKKFGPIQLRTSPSKSGRKKGVRQLSSRKSGGGGYLGSFRNELDDLPSMSMSSTTSSSSPMHSSLASATASMHQKHKALTPEAHIGIRCATTLSKSEKEQSPQSQSSTKGADPLVLPVFRYYKATVSRRERSCQFAGAFAMGYAITAALSMISVLLIASADLSLTLNSLSFVSPTVLTAETTQSKYLKYDDKNTGKDKLKTMGAYKLSNHNLSQRSDYTWKMKEYSPFACTTPADITVPVENIQTEMCLKDKYASLCPKKYSSFITASWYCQNQVPAYNVLPKINIMKCKQYWSRAVQRYLKGRTAGWIWKVVGLDCWRIPKPCLTHELDQAVQRDYTKKLVIVTPKMRYARASVSQGFKVVKIMSWMTMVIACLAVLIRGIHASYKVQDSDTGKKFRALRDKKETGVGIIAILAATCTLIGSLWWNLDETVSILVANLVTSLAFARIYCTAKLWAISEESIQSETSYNTEDSNAGQTPSTSRKGKASFGPGEANEKNAHEGGTRDCLRLSVASSNASSIINPQTPTATMYAGTPDGASSIISQPNLTTSQERYARHFGVLKPSEPRGAVGDMPEFKNTDAVAITEGEITCTDDQTQTDDKNVNVILPYPKYILAQRGELFIQKLMEKFHRLMELADVECRPHEWRKEGVYEGIAVESHSAGPKSVSGNSALMCRGMGTVRIPPAKFMSLLWLTQHKNKYDEMCERVTTLENINNHVKIEEQEYKGYGVVSSRRMVLLAGWQRVDFGSEQHPELELSDDVMFPTTNPHSWKYEDKAVLHGLFDSNRQIQKGDPAKKRFGGRPRNIADAAAVPNVPRNSCGHEYSADGYAMLAISIPDSLYDRPASAPPIDTSLVEANLELGGFVIRGIKLPKIEKKGGGLWGGGNTKLDVAAQDVPEEQDFIWGSEVWGLGSIDLGGRIPNWIASQISRRQPLLVGRGEKYMMTTKEEGKSEVLFNTIDVDYMYA